MIIIIINVKINNSIYIYIYFIIAQKILVHKLYSHSILSYFLCLFLFFWLILSRPLSFLCQWQLDFLQSDKSSTAKGKDFSKCLWQTKPIVSMCGLCQITPNSSSVAAGSGHFVSLFLPLASNLSLFKLAVRIQLTVLLLRNVHGSERVVLMF